MLIDKKPKELLEEFLTSYNKVHNININKAIRIIKSNIDYYKGDKNKRDELVYLQEPENIWYNALEKNKIDYSVYDDHYYFTDLWACWIIYSRGYLKGIVKENSLDGNISILSLFKDITSVLDLGCGIGYTTASLKQIFSKADIYGTNIEDTKQYLFCKSMSKKYNFKIVSDISKINHCIDLVFASEYFEHIEDSLEHLQDILKNLKPKYFIIANAFNTRSVGHFIEYKYGNIKINQAKMSKLFNKILVLNEYKKIKTKLWNNRPNIYIREN
uniref:Putative methyltransferase n=1 Tax=viral metagenome TaxID=1070528 RepID=A0A6M3KVW4_9ZZZZ